MDVQAPADVRDVFAVEHLAAGVVVKHFPRGQAGHFVLKTYAFLDGLGLTVVMYDPWQLPNALRSEAVSIVVIFACAFFSCALGSLVQLAHSRRDFRFVVFIYCSTVTVLLASPSVCLELVRILIWRAASG